MERRSLWSASPQAAKVPQAHSRVSGLFSRLSEPCAGEIFAHGGFQSLPDTLLCPSPSPCRILPAGCQPTPVCWPGLGARDGCSWPEVPAFSDAGGPVTAIQPKGTWLKTQVLGPKRILHSNCVGNAAPQSQSLWVLLLFRKDHVKCLTKVSLAMVPLSFSDLCRKGRLNLGPVPNRGCLQVLLSPNSYSAFNQRTDND